MLLAATACAVVKPPSGGPEDKTPPTIVSVVPAPDSSGVSRTSGIRLTFSEKVDSESFKKRIVTYPPLEFDKIRTDGPVLEITFREELPETTICLLVKSGFKDAHLVENKRNQQYYFSTSTRLQSGEITGKILFKQKPDSLGVAKLIELRGDTLGDIYTADESRVAFTDAFGNYIFRALPSDSSSFIIWGFVDTDRDGRYSQGKEFALIFPDTLTLTGERNKTRGIDLNVIDPDEPGSIEGDVVNLTGFDMKPMLRFNNIAPGSEAVVARCDSTGSFIIMRIPPGKYLYSAFIDLKPDSIPGQYTDPDDSLLVLDEPAWNSPDTLFIDPGVKKSVGKIVIGEDNEK